MTEQIEKRSLVKGALILFLKTLPWAIFGVITYFWYHGELNGIIKYLDNPKLAIKFGKVKITPFKIIKSALVVIYLFWFAAIISGLFSKFFSKIKTISSSNKSLVNKTVSILIYIVAFFLILEVLGIDLTTLAVFSGAIGIGLGFGLQKITSNFISGFIMLFEKAISEGDLLLLSSGIEGFVRKVGARATVIETWDGKEIMIPNEDFITNQVTNLTHSDKMGRFTLKIGVSYNADLKLAQKIIFDAANNHKFCSKKKPPECFLHEFADSSVTFILHMWIDDVTDGRNTATNDILFEVWEKFKGNNIEIPFPQRDLNIRNYTSFEK